MKIRPAIPQDFESYCALVSEADELHTKNAPRYYQDPGVPARPRAYFDSMFHKPDRALFLAERDGRPAGIILLELRTEPAMPILVPMKFVSVAEIVVAQACQRKGVGHALMEQAKVWAKQRGAKDLRLSVAVFNRTARDFYVREGFGVKHEVMAFPLDEPK